MDNESPVLQHCDFITQLANLTKVLQPSKPKYSEHILGQNFVKIRVRLVAR